MSTSDVVSQISEALSKITAENAELKESIEEVRAQFAYEDAGWQAILGFSNGDREKGLSLDEVKAVSEKARTRVAASALVKRAADLHAGYVFGNGVEIDNTVRDRAKTGRPPREVAFFESAINQESIFSGAAKRELQYARFSDGNVIVFCDTSDRTVRRVPISEISNVLVSPDYPDEVWAWLRTWTQVDPNGQNTTRKAWVYTNRFTGPRRSSIRVGNETIPVLRDVTAVDLRANRQIGWTFGVPDATAGLHWAEAYGEVLRYGQIVNESLAKIVYKVVSKTKAGAQSVGVKIGGSGAGGAAVVGEGQDIQLVNSTQRSFDFTAARPLAAMAAAAWNVTNPDLLADSSASGSSYGSLNALTPGMQNAMSAMREEWTQFYQDVFEVFGFGRPGVHWPPMNKPDPYRMAQELTLYSVALTDEEYRAQVLDRLDLPGDPAVIPASLAARVEPRQQAASPDQGRSSAAGQTDSTQRNDLQGAESALARFKNEEIVERLEAALAKLEALNI